MRGRKIQKCLTVGDSNLPTEPAFYNSNKRCFPIQTFLLISACTFLLSISVFAQDDETWRDTAPPPLKVLSKMEKTQLDGLTDAKQRTKLALDFMEIRLAKAEQLHTAEQYPEMFLELGSFHAIVDDTLTYLDKSDQSNKVLNNFKRIEITLRKYITRLELIRRDLPIKYELYVRKLVGHIRDARSRAVEPLFDDTVLREDKGN